MTVLPINLSSLVGKVSDLSEIRVTVRELELIARDNPDVRIETNAQGQVIFMPPTGKDKTDEVSSSA